jgi:hypothetical protein
MHSSLVPIHFYSGHLFAPSLIAHHTVSKEQPKQICSIILAR